jgi:hypothetical protein
MDVFSHQHTDVSLMPICVVAPAGCLEGEVAYTTARRSADRTASLGHELTYLQVAGHVDDEHMCSALAHMCGEVRVNFCVAVRPLSRICDIASLAPSRG